MLSALDLQHWRNVASEPSAEGGVTLTEQELWHFIDSVDLLLTKTRRQEKTLRDVQGYVRTALGALSEDRW